ncbi:hypothetical protein C4573_05180 [Candidatus Woesearchaeota archaeon]|nr:MAG: hypothetical protein C4573_05180 [Candidatus Woesearchaeota archaeon]
MGVEALCLSLPILVTSYAMDLKPEGIAAASLTPQALTYMGFRGLELFVNLRKIDHLRYYIRKDKVPSISTQ